MAVVALSACSDSSAPTSPTAPVPPTPAVGPSIRIDAPDVVTLNPGGGGRLSVALVDADGKPIRDLTGSVAWTSSDSGVVRVDATGAYATGPDLGEAWVSARTADGLSDSTLVWIEPPATVASTFAITLVFAADVPAAWRAAFRSAADRWEEVVRAPLPAVDMDSVQPCPVPPGEPPWPEQTGTEKGVRILVGYSGAFPPGTYAEAVGGPCIQRPQPRPTTILGRITLNRDYDIASIEPGRIRYLAVHEMGHVLGLVAVINGFQPAWFDIDTGGYTAPLALWGYRLETGTRVARLQVDPGNHWLEAGDVMSRAPSDRITDFTVGALMDLGYPAAWYGAGPY